MDIEDKDLFVYALNISARAHKKLIIWFASRKGNWVGVWRARWKKEFSLFCLLNFDLYEHTSSSKSSN